MPSVMSGWHWFRLLCSCLVDVDVYEHRLSLQNVCVDIVLMKLAADATLLSSGMM